MRVVLNGRDDLIQATHYRAGDSTFRSVKRFVIGK